MLFGVIEDRVYILPKILLHSVSERYVPHTEVSLCFVHL
jgi:hypothetical protein